MKLFDPDRGGAWRRAVDDLVLGWPDVAARPMFGCPSYTVRGALFAVVVTDGIALTRLPATDRHALEATVPVEPFRAGDRTVPGWALVRAGPSDLGALRPFVRSSYRTARTEADD